MDIDKVLKGISDGNPLYFQLVPILVRIVQKDAELPAPGTTYRFAIFKGKIQKI